MGYYPKNSTVIKTNNNKDQYNQGQILTLQKPLSKNQNFYFISIAIGLIYYFLSSCITQTKKIQKVINLLPITLRIDFYWTYLFLKI